MRGLHASLARRVASLAGSVPPGEAIFLSGGVALNPAMSRRRMLAEVRRHFKALPPDEYPTVVELADELAQDDPDGLFDFGLRVWLAGLAPLRRVRAG